ncbi:hypothetical protein [Nitratireductor sp. GCM10026969]|uniref:hypothetical protein n=1 Tax=Nitratireductor sp. GCM10026969 TaxID=3252645 RepID=UPI003619A32A
MSNPEIVFADEPTAALDRDAGLQVVRMLKALGDSRGWSTVMVTHDPRIVDLADRIVTIEDGRLVRIEMTQLERISETSWYASLARQMRVQQFRTKTHVVLGSRHTVLRSR